MNPVAPEISRRLSHVLNKSTIMVLTSPTLLRLVNVIDNIEAIWVFGFQLIKLLLEQDVARGNIPEEQLKFGRVFRLCQCVGQNLPEYVIN